MFHKWKIFFDPLFLLVYGVSNVSCSEVLSTSGCFYCWCYNNYFEPSGSEEENDDEEENTENNKQVVEIRDEQEVEEDDDDDEEEEEEVDVGNEMTTASSLTVGDLIEAMKTKQKQLVSQPSSVVSCLIIYPCTWTGL